MMKKTGAEIFVECLIKEKVDIMFGIPGGVLLPIFDKLYGSPVRLVLTRHEQGAAHMADGYARSTGKTGVCIATSGPGATNLVTGLATAYMDSIPVVAFTGQVATTLIGNDAFQEADTTGITRPVTKHNFLVRDVRELARTIKEAFHIASTGRPGPVLIDIPVDVQRAETEFVWPENLEIRSYKPNYKGHPVQIKRASEAIDASHKPVLYVGGGVVTSDASKEVIELAKKADIPVTTTLLAMGAFPPDSPLSLGMLGMHGTYWANHAMQNSDLIIAVGSRFDDRCTGKLAAFAPKAKVVHIDIDPTSISKNVKTDIPLVGDAKAILTELNKTVKKASHEKWIETIDGWKKKHPLLYKEDNKLRPQYVIETISELTKGEAIVVTEVGQHQMWSAQYYSAKLPRHFLSSGGLGTMGFGFPAAIGAKMANPGKLVIDIAGDGSFQMNIQELATAVLNEVNVKIVILNNKYLGMVRQWQEMFYGKRYSSTCLHRHEGCPPKCNEPGGKDCQIYIPDFVKVAEAYGALGMRVTDKKDVVPTLKKAFSVKKPVVMEFMVEQEENVLPMVPTGAALDEIITRLA
ncbi:MAG: biosynthetic-type acetolactate synthase large subunit [Endomicrobiales bacterium]|nr:biosynthetic-type acetolactate synthase large subunit [Endomicrobiales bacterium]